MATFANVQIQRDVQGKPFTLTVTPTGGGKFDLAWGVENQTFNYGNGIERIGGPATPVIPAIPAAGSTPARPAIPATVVGLTLTEDTFIFSMLQSGSADHNFKIKMTTDAPAVGISPGISGNGMKLVGAFMSTETPV